jgi:uncharacterized protein (TIGR02147 family)
MQELDDLSRPSIFEYEDYRVYLKDLYSFLKKQRMQFSFRYFSKRAGFTSPNFLKLVIENKRNLSSDSIARFSTALKLTASESEFFNRLVHFNQSQTEADKAHWSLQLLRCKGFQKIHPLRQAEYSYYANWYYVPIREMVGLKSFRDDPLWISQHFRPALTTDQVKTALHHLQDLNLISKDEKGLWTQTQKSITTGNEVHHNFVKQYHQQMIQKASDAIDFYPRELREISAVCIPVSKNKLEDIKKMIQDFRKELLAVAESDEDANSIYQLNIQCFPVALPTKDDI